MKAAQEVASNANPRAATGPAPRAVGLNPNAAVNALFSSNQNVRMQEGGVPSEAMMAQEGIMEVASEEVKDNLNERMSVTPDVSQPQNVEERSIYDRAMLAVQGMLEPEEAQMAIEEFIETFGPEAYSQLIIIIERVLYFHKQVAGMSLLTIGALIAQDEAELLGCFIH